MSKGDRTCAIRFLYGHPEIKSLEEAAPTPLKMGKYIRNQSLYMSYMLHQNLHTCPVALVREALAKRFFGSFANWACIQKNIKIGDKPLLVDP